MGVRWGWDRWDGGEMGLRYGEMGWDGDEMGVRWRWDGAELRRGRDGVKVERIGMLHYIVVEFVFKG